MEPCTLAPLFGHTPTHASGQGRDTVGEAKRVPAWRGRAGEMADVEKSKDHEEVLKLFYHRASEAEERLAKLESLFANKKGDTDMDNKEMANIIKEFQSKLEIAQVELMAEREKASKDIQKLKSENSKLHYRITHLVRALKDADSKSST